MGGRRWQMDGAVIFRLLHGAFLFHLATSQSFIGVNYGTIADNLPPAASTASLLTSTSIGKLRLYEPQPDLVAALAGSDISILLGVPNSDVPSLASSPAAAASWAAANIPTTVSVSAISVGNELLNSGDPTLGPKLLPAMQNLLAALPAGSTTKISTVHSMAVLASSDPPSSGAFHQDLAGSLDPVLEFLHQNGGPFMINPYPYFAYASDTREETLAFCLFQPNPGRVDAASGLTYMNMFDAQLDAIRAALDAKGYPDVDIVIAETGWPYKGDADEAGATPDNAKAYNGNLVAHLKSEVGTPRTPGKSVDTYIFALYDEDLKPGPASERSFGLYQTDLTANYDIGLAKGSGTTPSTSGQIGVTPAPAQGTPQPGRGVTPTGFCVTTGGVPGSAQQVQQSSSCYEPAGATAQRGRRRSGGGSAAAGVCGRWFSSPAAALYGASSSSHRHGRPRISAEVPWASFPWSSSWTAEPPRAQDSRSLVDSGGGDSEDDRGVVESLDQGGARQGRSSSRFPPRRGGRSRRRLS